ncbi:DUF2264 domain-containing protein [Devosia sp. FKR38]|uniref:DUF2264 domain-containing protein n=1 Tax=Devosia sp. FKR38 TaxID=2562312 RepID=UPI0024A6A80F|nr:DUF2264 domain-containing protein [Devosia sp. FKR38]
MSPFNPLHRNPLRTRGDLARATRDLVAPCLPFLMERPGRLALGSTAAVYETVVAEFEGFARLFWGLLPFFAGGFRYEAAEQALRAGIIAGTDPDHDSFWGEPGDLLRGHRDQRLVEMAPIGLALALCPELFWDPLAPAEKERLAHWLKLCMARPYNDNNWLFFRVMVSLGLSRVGVDFDAQAVETHLERLESFFIAKGWYEDGVMGRYDHYIAFAMHFYGLIYAQLAGERDPERASRFRQRAAEFAPDYAAWFADGGAGLPYGRSLTYRFAHASFWGALAYAGCTPYSWGTLKGLALRNLRYWSHQPIAHPNGVLSLGYGYANPAMIEEYSTDGSPLWALKAMLPLALPADHPFWTAEEEPHPLAASHVTFQPDPKFALFRHEGAVFAAAGGQSAISSGAGASFRNAAAKYAKFAYSTAHGFSVELDPRHPQNGAFDNALALKSSGDAHWRVREGNESFRRERNAMVATWRPWPDIPIETWLLVAAPWLVRLHIIHTDRPLESIEGGFAVDRSGDDHVGNTDASAVGGSDAIAAFPAGGSAIRDLLGRRQGEVIYASANSNLLFPRSAIPSLRGKHAPGVMVLATAIVTSTQARDLQPLLAAGPELPDWFAHKLYGLAGERS